MSELPYMKFYPTDYLAATRTLSPSAKGAWMDILCAMWDSRSRGVLDMRLSAYGRLIGTTEERTAQIIQELEESNVAEVQWSDGKDSVRIRSRRIAKDWGQAEARHQAQVEGGRKGGSRRAASQAQATLEARLEGKLKPPLKPSSSSTRSQKPEARIRERETAREAQRIVDLWPKRSKLREALEAVTASLVDGASLEAIETGTQAIAAAVRARNAENNKFTPSAGAFFDGELWRDSPEAFASRYDSRQTANNHQTSERQRDRDRTGRESTAGKSLRRL